MQQIVFASFLAKKIRLPYGCLFLLMLSGNLFGQALDDTSKQVYFLQEVVVSASRFSEKKISSPVSVSAVSQRHLQQSAAPSFYDALATVKGVHLVTPSLGFKVLNTRGFSNTTNVRFVQLIDNADNQSPHIGAPIANALGPSGLDIDHVEVVQGVASALYGMNATNGLVNFTTKDPFTSTGVTVQQQLGINHLSDPNRVSAKLYNETSFRWAQVFAKKWAFKLNAGFNKGYDWVADNKTDLNPAANESVGLTGDNNPAYDPVNGYGNESSNRKSLSLNGKNYVVARTGYAERFVTDYHLQNSKADASVYLKPNDHALLSYTFRVAYLNTIYQRSNRFSLQNYLLQQHVLQYRGRFLQARAYVTAENTGNSYNLRSMAENIDNKFKNTNSWYADYTNTYKAAFAQSNDAASAHQAARAMADNGRLQPGTTAFNTTVQQLQQINNWDQGAALKVRAQLLHAETSVDIGKWLGANFNLQAGADARTYIIVPDGNYFINPNGKSGNLTYSSAGFFTHASRSFFHNKLSMAAALRISSYQYASAKLHPRLTAVLQLNTSSILRFSYQHGYRFASIFEGFSNINSGGVKRVGGLKIMSDGIFEKSWLKTSIDAFQSAVNKDVNTNNLSQAAAIKKNKSLLKKNTYTYLQPEQLHSFELGYRVSGFNNQLFIDADVYFNHYKNFIAQTEASIPNTSDSALIPAYLFDRNKQNRYRLWTNSKTVVMNYGVEVDTRFIASKKLELFANGSYQALRKTNQDDGLEDGFNTPEWMVNAGIASANLYKTLGVSATAKYQGRYYWQSFLVNGNVPAIFTLDAVARYQWTKPRIELKLGAANLLNHYYYSILGGPQIGALYYSTITFEW